jgi:hypothetical protein
MKKPVWAIAGSVIAIAGLALAGRGAGGRSS